MTTPLKAELKDSLRQLRLPEFAAQHSQQSAVAMTENWTYDQYLLKLELQQHEVRKRRKLLAASRLPREKTLDNFERGRLR